MGAFEIVIALRVLGPLELDKDGSVVPLPGPRETEVLAMLAARYPRSTSTAELLDDLWGRDHPGGAERTLRSYVSTLRRALRTAGLEQAVVTEHRGYSLSSTLGETIDARTFESLLRYAERMRDEGEPQARIHALDAGLRLWRGRAFAEVCSAPGVAPHARYLDEARLAATEQWVEARLQAGAHAELAPELSSICHEHPLRERLWELWMLALYRAGRQAHALEVYRELRGRLHDELGIEPGEGARQLELAILRQEPELRLPPRIAESVAARRDARRPLPQSLRSPNAVSFVGRGRELDALEVAWVLAQDGATNPVLVCGEPGIGKSTLAGAFADRLSRRGVRVLCGRCESDAPVAYQPFRDVLAPLLDEYPHLSGADLAPWEPAGPADPDSPAEAHRTRDPETARWRLFDAVCELVSCVARDVPLLIVLEDLHWADVSTLLLLRHLARRSRPAALLLVGTYRDTETPPGSPLDEALADLRREPGATTLRLRGLPESDVVALLAAAARKPGGPDPWALAGLLHLATEGNPLYVRQMLAHFALAPETFLTETGALRSNPPLPAGVRDAIDRRLALLAPDTVSTLALAAVIGTEFELDLLAAAHGGQRLRESLEQAQHASLIVGQPGGRVRFVHQLVRQSVYEQLSDARRRRLHGQVAEALETLAVGEPSSLPALAEHFASAARPGSTSKAVGYARQAASQALRQLAFAEAAAIAQRGLDCIAMEREPDIEMRCELSLLLAEARLLARDIQGCKRAAGTAGEDARRLREDDQLARAAIVCSHLNTFGQPSEITARLCEDALEAIGERTPVVRAQILAGFADYIASSEGDAPGAERVSQQALALARGCGDSAALARALFVHAEVLGWSPRIQERMALADELMQLAIATDDPRARANAHHVRALARLESGDIKGFDSDLDAIDSLRRQIDYWYIDMFTLLWRGMRALMDGRHDHVEQNATELLAYAGHEPNVVNLYAGQLSWSRREQGRVAELRPLVEDAIKHSPDVTGFRCGLALIHADLGELSQASEQLDHLATDNFDALPRDATWTTSLTLLAEVATAVGDRRRARTLYELLLPYSGTLIVTTKGMVCAGAADRYLGLLAATNGEAETADRYFQSALALETKIEAPALIARTNNCYQRALRA